jgi:aldose sugar dehydrogenase
MILADIVVQLTDMNYMKRPALFILVSLSVAASLFCKKSTSPGDEQEPPTGPVEIKDSVITGNLSHPWEILWGPDNFIWITERAGKISRLNPATGAKNTVITISEVEATGEGGLLGMVLHPNFSTTPQVFVSYNYDGGSGYREKVVRFTYNGTTLINPFTVIDNIGASDIHNGSRLVISPDLKLFISTGDAANPATAQNVSSRNGKILRLNLDGSVPADNPVAGNPYWSWGHRNPQGLVFANNK